MEHLNPFAVLAVGLSRVYYADMGAPLWQQHEALCHTDGSACDGGASCSLTAEATYVLEAEMSVEYLDATRPARLARERADQIWGMTPDLVTGERPDVQARGRRAIEALNRLEAVGNVKEIG